MASSRPSCRDEFEVAIICALAIEADAVFLIFDELWDGEADRYGKVSGDHNTYTTGRIGSYNVVLTILPGMGTTNAASAAANMRLSYTGLRLALLVGVCGVMPYSQDNEILLGDVIISEAVAQYDFGRQYPDKFMKKTGITDQLSRPHKDVRSLLSILKTDRVRGLIEKRTEYFLSQLQLKISQTKKPNKYHYPGTANDKLYQPDYRHKHHVSSTYICRNCHNDSDPICDKVIGLSCADAGCSDDYLVERKRLQTSHLRLNQQPMIHIGFFASGNTVLKSAAHRNQLSKELSAIAFEMEAAGIWDEMPCVVVKAACDYADCHKQKMWQHFASAMAASASKAILERFIQIDKIPVPDASRIPHVITEIKRNVQILTTLLEDNDEEIPDQLKDLATELSQLGLRPLEKPATLRDMCDSASCSDLQVFSYRRPTKVQSVNATCNCPRNPRTRTTTRWDLGIGPFNIYSRKQDIKQHSEDCPGRMLNLLVDASFTYQARGGGGLTIGRHLNIQTVVPKSSVCEVLSNLEYDLMKDDLESPTDVAKLLRSARCKILRLYDKREASPFEVNLFGRTHLHEFFLMIEVIPYFCFTEYSVYFELSQMMLTFANKGVPCNVESRYGLTSLDYLMYSVTAHRDELKPLNKSYHTIEFKFYSKIIENLVEIIDYLPEFHVGLLTWSWYMDINSEYLELLDDGQLSPLVRAVCMKSEKKLLSVLQNSPESVSEPVDDVTILHLAVTWPRGLSILLSHGGQKIIDKRVDRPEDSFSAAPFHIACVANCAESVRILVDAGCSINLDNMSYDDDIISLQCSKEVAKGLFDRRKQLFHLAKESLTTAAIRQFKCKDGEVPDKEARQIMEAIESAGFDVPDNLTVSQSCTSVYHAPILKAAIPIFYNAGFHDLSSKSFTGLTPIMMGAGYGLGIFEYWNADESIVSIMDWAKQHNLLDQKPIDPLSLGINIAATVRRIAEDLIQQFSEDVFGSGSTDECHCWCSGNGCTPFISYCKEQAWATWSFGESSVILERLFDDEDSTLSKKAIGSLKKQFIRFLTFEALEMTHTCCQYKTQEVDCDGRDLTTRFIKNFQGNVTEIQEEESEIYGRLVYLMKKLLPGYFRSNKNLMDFMWDDWRACMEEECIPSREEEDRLRESGVEPDEIYVTPEAVTNLLKGLTFWVSEDEADN